jgi:hypothetical protein
MTSLDKISALLSLSEGASRHTNCVFYDQQRQKDFPRLLHLRRFDIDYGFKATALNLDSRAKIDRCSR